MSKERPSLPAKLAGKGTAVPVVLSVSDDSKSTGQVSIEHWDESARTTRALKRLGLFWLGALLSLPVPFLHFCLVPGLFLAGPVAAWLAYRQQSIVLGGAGTCPQCGGIVEIERNPEEWPLQVQCAGCRAWSSVAKGERTGGG